MFLKTSFFVQFFFHLISYSYPYIRPEQRIFIEKNENGVPNLDLIDIEFNKEHKAIKVVIKLNEPVMMTILPIFFDHIHFEPKDKKQKEYRSNGIKILSFQNALPCTIERFELFMATNKNNFFDNMVLEGSRIEEKQAISYLGICLKFYRKGKYFIRVIPEFKEESKKGFQFIRIIRNNKKEECVSIKTTDNSEILKILEFLMKGISIKIGETNLDYKDMEIVETGYNDEDENYAFFKPLFDENFKLNEENKENDKGKKTAKGKKRKNIN
uniref:Uncharacterized protein n=1 Tax=Meloidogyne hapla TaxID=6305 RepID=A0A1I8C1Q7_MELHA